MNCTRAAKRSLMRPALHAIFFGAILTLPAFARVAGAQARPDAAHALSESQQQALKRIRAESERKAAPGALRLGAIAHKIYENMLSDNPDERTRIRLERELKSAAGELLMLKGQAIRDAVHVLTPEQKRLLRVEMRKPGAPGDLSEVIDRTFKPATP